MKKISVIIPVYNTIESYIRECVKSIINQKYDNFEIIIIDDGSETVNSKIYDDIKTIDDAINEATLEMITNKEEYK